MLFSKRSFIAAIALVAIGFSVLFALLTLLPSQHQIQSAVLVDSSAEIAFECLIDAGKFSQLDICAQGAHRPFDKMEMSCRLGTAHQVQIILLLEDSKNGLMVQADATVEYKWYQLWSRWKLFQEKKLLNTQAEQLLIQFKNIVEAY